MPNEHKLYMQGAHGINHWSIHSEGSTIHIQANGQIFYEDVETNQSGRSIDEQVKLRVDARVRGKLDQGFKRSIEEAKRGITNQLGLASPMLATPLKNVRNPDYDLMWVQPKLDGHRCLIGNNGAYSRRGKPIDTIPGIVDSLNKILDGNNFTLDGELYHHGTSLQTISSWAKRYQVNTDLLEFHVYDLIPHHDPKMEYGARKALLDLLALDFGPRVKLVETIGYEESWGTLGHWVRERERGYEGAILRHDKGLYGIGKRSKDLIKVKQRHDAEYKCLDVIPSREGWGVLVLETNDRTFKTLAPGPVYQKIKTLRQKEKYIGKHVTCEYADLTDDGIPFHCVAIRWREDL